MSGGKILFLDRDGVINVDTGHPHVIDEMQFVEGIFDLCVVAGGLGYQIIIITNQAGIAKGHYDEEQFFRVMNWMTGQFMKRGIEILDYYFCPHHVDGHGKYRKNCPHRKPEPGMILAACTDHDIDLKNSIIIGDKISDMAAGRRANIGTLLFFDAGGNEKTNMPDNIRKFIQLSDITEFLKYSNEIRKN